MIVFPANVVLYIEYFSLASVFPSKLYPNGFYIVITIKLENIENLRILKTRG